MWEECVADGVTVQEQIQAIMSRDYTWFGVVEGTPHTQLQ